MPTQLEAWNLHKYFEEKKAKAGAVVLTSRSRTYRD